MEICYKCGVKVVTVYAFSIENFNRPKYEVEGLMQLAKVKLEQLTTYGDILDRYGACVRVIGQRDMIREDVLQVVDKAVARTKHNNQYVKLCETMRIYAGRNTNSLIELFSTYVFRIHRELKSPLRFKTRLTTSSPLHHQRTPPSRHRAFVRRCSQANLTATSHFRRSEPNPQKNQQTPILSRTRIWTATEAILPRRPCSRIHHSLVIKTRSIQSRPRNCLALRRLRPIPWIATCTLLRTLL